MRWLATIGIKFYQYVISPRKGFTCAHDALHKQGGCSSRVLSHIQSKPVSQWYGAYRTEMQACKKAFETIKKQKDKQPKNKRKMCSEGVDCGLEAIDCTDLNCDCDIGSC